MRRHKHLFEEVVSFDNLLGAARDALRGRRLRQPGASFYASLEQHVVDLQSELSSETYQPGDYHYFRIYEPNGLLLVGGTCGSSRKTNHSC